VWLAEGGLEGFESCFEVGDVDVLRFDECELGFVSERVGGGVAQQGVRVSRFVNLESFPAMRADYFVHVSPPVATFDSETS
jgi:hypothetical protein